MESSATFSPDDMSHRGKSLPKDKPHHQYTKIDYGTPSPKAMYYRKRFKRHFNDPAGESGLPNGLLSALKFIITD